MKRRVVGLFPLLFLFALSACGRDEVTAVTAMSASSAATAVLRDVILFSTDEFGPLTQLAAMAPDGSNRRRITHDDDHYYGAPAISPDGRRIAVNRSTRDFTPEGIFLLNADGSEPTLLVHNSTVFDGQPAWSPDGRQIAFVSWVEVNGFGPYGRIFVINVDGTGLRQLSDVDGIVSQLDEGPSWSPDGSRITFTRNFLLQVINADGTGLVAVPHEDFAIGPAWSPDGQRIAYTSFGATSSVRIVNADGSNPVTVAAGGGPRWSPDGRRLVFNYAVGRDIQIHVVNVDGTGDTRLSFGTADNSPTWSPVAQGRSDAGILVSIAPFDAKLAPGDTRQFSAVVRSTGSDVFSNARVTWSSSDPTVATVSTSGLVTAVGNGVALIGAAFGGQTARAQVRVVDRVLQNAIVYSTDEFGAPEFAVVRPDGSGRRRLTTDQIGYDTPPDLSPDGSRILFAKVFSILVMNVDVAGLTEGYTEVMFDVDNPPSVPVWSPDGSQIAFISAERVWVINTDGSGRRQVSPDGEAADGAPTWSPDGTRLAFTRAGVLQVINTDGTGLSSLGNADPASEPDWSPDGTRIAYASPHGIMIRNADGSNPGTVTTTAGDSHPRWSPESGRLVFARVVDGKSQLFVINANGTGETRVSTGVGAESAPSWSPVP